MQPTTIKQAAEHFKGSSLTESAIRRAVVSGAIPSIRVGNKYLLLIENIEAWLLGELPPQEKPTDEVGIRRIAEWGGAK